MLDHLFAMILPADFCINKIFKTKYLLRKKKNPGSDPEEYPHSLESSCLSYPQVRKQISVPASQTLTVCPVHYNLDSQSACVPAGIGVYFDSALAQPPAFACLFTSRLGLGAVKLRCLSEDNMIQKADPDELFLKHHFF